MLKVKCDYTNWFVLQVRTSKEHFIKNFIESHAGDAVRMIIFSRELVFERKHKEIKCLSPLFPSYIFVYKNVNLALAVLKRNEIDEWIKPLCFKGKQERCATCFVKNSPCMVFPQEMEFLLNNTDERGTIGLSYGIQHGEDVEIINGPLRQLHSHIVWINQRKKKVCVEIELFKRKMRVNLGLDILHQNDL